MGYTTEFEGRFTFDRPLEPEHAAYINKFSETRRMKRISKIAEELPDPVRKAARLPIGDEGCFFVGAEGWAGQEKDKSVVDFNKTPAGQPGLWCQWTVTEDCLFLEWNGTEKFYNYTEWLAYLITNFLKPWGYTLNGEVSWEGEDRSDVGLLMVTDNVVSTHVGLAEMAKAAKDPKNKPEFVVLTATFTKKLLNNYKKSGDEREAMDIADIVIKEYKTSEDADD